MEAASKHHGSGLAAVYEFLTLREMAALSVVCKSMTSPDSTATCRGAGAVHGARITPSLRPKALSALLVNPRLAGAASPTLGTEKLVGQEAIMGLDVDASWAVDVLRAFIARQFDVEAVTEAEKRVDSEPAILSNPELNMTPSSPQRSRLVSRLSKLIELATLPGHCFAEHQPLGKLRVLRTLLEHTPMSVHDGRNIHMPPMRVEPLLAIGLYLLPNTADALLFTLTMLRRLECLVVPALESKTTASPTPPRSRGLLNGLGYLPSQHYSPTVTFRPTIGLVAQATVRLARKRLPFLTRHLEGSAVVLSQLVTSWISGVVVAALPMPRPTVAWAVDILAADGWPGAMYLVLVVLTSMRSDLLACRSPSTVASYLRTVPKQVLLERDHLRSIGRQYLPEGRDETVAALVAEFGSSSGAPPSRYQRVVQTLQAMHRSPSSRHWMLFPPSPSPASTPATSTPDRRGFASARELADRFAFGAAAPKSPPPVPDGSPPFSTPEPPVVPPSPPPRPPHQPELEEKQESKMVDTAPFFAMAPSLSGSDTPWDDQFRALLGAAPLRVQHEADVVVGAGGLLFSKSRPKASKMTTADTDWRIAQDHKPGLVTTTGVPVPTSQSSTIDRLLSDHKRRFPSSASNSASPHSILLDTRAASVRQIAEASYARKIPSPPPSVAGGYEVLEDATSVLSTPLTHHQGVSAGVPGTVHTPAGAGDYRSVTSQSIFIDSPGGGDGGDDPLYGLSMSANPGFIWSDPRFAEDGTAVSVVADNAQRGTSPNHDTASVVSTSTTHTRPEIAWGERALRRKDPLHACKLLGISPTSGQALPQGPSTDSSASRSDMSVGAKVALRAFMGPSGSVGSESLSGRLPTVQESGANLSSAASVASSSAPSIVQSRMHSSPRRRSLRAPRITRPSAVGSFQPPEGTPPRHPPSWSQPAPVNSNPRSLFGSRRKELISRKGPSPARVERSLSPSLRRPRELTRAAFRSARKVDPSDRSSSLSRSVSAPRSRPSSSPLSPAEPLPDAGAAPPPTTTATTAAPSHSRASVDDALSVFSSVSTSRDEPHSGPRPPPSDMPKLAITPSFLSVLDQFGLDDGSDGESDGGETPMGSRGELKALEKEILQWADPAHRGMAAQVLSDAGIASPPASAPLVPPPPSFTSPQARASSPTASSSKDEGVGDFVRSFLSRAKQPSVGLAAAPPPPTLHPTDAAFDAEVESKVSATKEKPRIPGHVYATVPRPSQAAGADLLKRINRLFTSPTGEEEEEERDGGKNGAAVPPPPKRPPPPRRDHHPPSSSSSSSSSSLQGRGVEGGSLSKPPPPPSRPPPPTASLSPTSTLPSMPSAQTVLHGIIEPSVRQRQRQAVSLSEETNRSAAPPPLPAVARSPSPLEEPVDGGSPSIHHSGALFPPSQRTAEAPAFETPPQLVPSSESSRFSSAPPQPATDDPAASLLLSMNTSPTAQPLAHDEVRERLLGRLRSGASSSSKSRFGSLQQLDW